LEGRVQQPGSDATPSADPWRALAEELLCEPIDVVFVGTTSHLGDQRILFRPVEARLLGSLSRPAPLEEIVDQSDADRHYYQSLADPALDLPYPPGKGA
jgi:hypothetical protein